jgi:hypothetical protein
MVVKLHPQGRQVVEALNVRAGTADMDRHRGEYRNGVDPDWASWYAERIVERFAADPVRRKV